MWPARPVDELVGVRRVAEPPRGEHREVGVLRVGQRAHLGEVAGRLGGLPPGGGGLVGESRGVQRRRRGPAAGAAGLASGWRASPSGRGRVAGPLGRGRPRPSASPAARACRARASWVRSQARSTWPSPPSQGWKRRPSRTASASAGRSAVTSSWACSTARSSRAPSAVGMLLQPAQADLGAARRSASAAGRSRTAAAASPGATARARSYAAVAASGSCSMVVGGHAEVAPDHRVGRVELGRAPPEGERLVGPAVRVAPVTEQRGRGRVGRVGAQRRLQGGDVVEPGRRSSSVRSPARARSRAAAAPSWSPRRSSHGGREVVGEHRAGGLAQRPVGIGARRARSSSSTAAARFPTRAFSSATSSRVCASVWPRSVVEACRRAGGPRRRAGRGPGSRPADCSASSSRPSRRSSTTAQVAHLAAGRGGPAEPASTRSQRQLVAAVARVDQRQLVVRRRRPTRPARWPWRRRRTPRRRGRAGPASGPSR